MVILYLLFPLFVNAHVIQDDVATTDRANFSFRTVCNKMVTHESPLIEVASGTELDCMGKKVQVGEFCEKELAADPYYLRGYVNRDKKEVVCVSGKKVLFKYHCVKLSDKKLCGTDAKSACVFIQNKLAKRLDMIHSSFTRNDKGIKQLNCFFESIPLHEKK